MKDLAYESEHLGDLFRHLWLFQTVAKAAGIDLSAALRSGELSHLDYAKLVTRCRSGGCSNACALWSSARKPGEGPAVPDFCPSAQTLKRLMP